MKTMSPLARATAADLKGEQKIVHRGAEDRPPKLVGFKRGAHILQKVGFWRARGGEHGPGTLKIRFFLNAWRKSATCLFLSGILHVEGQNRVFCNDFRVAGADV